MALISKTRSNYIESSRIILESINKDESVKTLLSANDYDETSLQALDTLRLDSVALFNQEIVRRNEALAKSSEVTRLFDEIRLEYGSIRKRMKTMFIDDPEGTAAFGLTKPIEETIANVISQNINFYNAALTKPELLAKAQTAGITQTRLQAGLARVQAYQTLRTEYVSMRGSLQELVEARDKSIRILRSNMNALVYTLRLVYKDNPQALESLGIFARNKPVKKKKNTQDPGTDPGTTDPGATDPTTITTDPGTTDPGTTPTDPGTTTGDTDPTTNPTNNT